MPTYARGQIVIEDTVGVYHCIARCVRRAFLCGTDSYTGQDYSHRKDWILDRLRELAGLFSIEVCGYSVMSTLSCCWIRTGRSFAGHRGDSGSPGLYPGPARAESVQLGGDGARLRRQFKQAAGRSSSLVDAAARRSRCWFQGKTAAGAAFV